MPRLGSSRDQCWIEMATRIEGDAASLALGSPGSVRAEGHLTLSVLLRSIRCTSLGAALRDAKRVEIFRLELGAFPLPDWQLGRRTITTEPWAATRDARDQVYEIGGRVLSAVVVWLLCGTQGHKLGRCREELQEDLVAIGTQLSGIHSSGCHRWCRGLGSRGGERSIRRTSTSTKVPKVITTTIPATSKIAKSAVILGATGVSEIAKPVIITSGITRGLLREVAEAIILFAPIRCWVRWSRQGPFKVIEVIVWFCHSAPGLRRCSWLIKFVKLVVSSQRTAHGWL
mmetsp:Transcript_332/g.813  ORF Transcript_332/g.813 Transcript_332/m.813 type:complete len:286 (-) Transcript_332:241-1098(-)